MLFFTCPMSSDVFFVYLWAFCTLSVSAYERWLAYVFCMVLWRRWALRQNTGRPSCLCCEVRLMGRLLLAWCCSPADRLLADVCQSQILSLNDRRLASNNQLTERISVHCDVFLPFFLTLPSRSINQASDLGGFSLQCVSSGQKHFLWSKTCESMPFWVLKMVEPP